MLKFLGQSSLTLWRWLRSTLHSGAWFWSSKAEFQGAYVSFLVYHDDLRYVVVALLLKQVWENEFCSTHGNSVWSHHPEFFIFSVKGIHCIIFCSSPTKSSGWPTAVVEERVAAKFCKWVWSCKNRLKTSSIIRKFWSWKLEDTILSREKINPLRELLKLCACALSVSIPLLIGKIQAIIELKGNTCKGKEGLILWSPNWNESIQYYCNAHFEITRRNMNLHRGTASKHVSKQILWKLVVFFCKLIHRTEKLKPMLISSVSQSLKHIYVMYNLVTTNISHWN